ncbi:MAG: class I SAM-dependent methyltransferase [Parasphingorhabdus sp.]
MKTSLPLPMAPTGFTGRLFGQVMETTNTPAYRHTIELIAPAAGYNILEIGFGTGKMLEMMADLEPSLVLAGIEPTQTMLDVALGRSGLRHWGGQLDLQLGDASNLPWKSQKFDAVAALHCFQFWDQPVRAVSEILRVLKPSGKLVIVLRDHSRNAPDYLTNSISKSGDEVNVTIALLLEQGFTTAEVEGETGTSSVILAKK